MSYVCRCPLTPRVLALGGWALEARVPSKSWFDLGTPHVVTPGRTYMIQVTSCAVQHEVGLRRRLGHAPARKVFCPNSSSPWPSAVCNVGDRCLLCGKFIIMNHVALLFGCGVHHPRCVQTPEWPRIQPLNGWTPCVFGVALLPLS